MPNLLHGLLRVRLGGNVFFVQLHASSASFDFSDVFEKALQSPIRSRGLFFFHTVLPPGK